MLPAPHRLRRRTDFALTVKRGRRAGSAHLVTHMLLDDMLLDDTPLDNAGTRSMQTPRSAPTPARVGFIVSKGVGNAVARGRVKRRLRALMAERIDRLPVGSLTVIRANPPAAQASSGELALSLDRTLGRLLPVPVGSA